MDLQQRFEIIETIGSGDFAVVYKARDRELGREVAIKQIHQQFLAEPEKLEQYWQEAQLLARLEHPNIMTIYDISRSSGWLVLELMQGSLKDMVAGQPMNLDYLRVTLFHCLHALKYMHEHGIVHGDVKPGNLLLDRRNRIKIGDFGLARRAADDEGSLLKGTTKYMSPEVFTDQFGPVTPASDLYSLGFTAYELLCGSRFEDLFPGLGAFGKDKQIAWIMWHAAADRKLPEIGRVLEGVPEDLTHVIGRLVEKDPARRYRSADEALADLLQDPSAGSPPPSAEEEVAAEEAKAQRRKRRFAIGALSISVVLSLAMLFIGGEDKPLKPQVNLQNYHGVIRNVEANFRTLVLDVGSEDQPPQIRLNNTDEIRLNGRRVALRDLQPGDRVEVHEEIRNGQKMTVVEAFRAEASQGTIKRVLANQGKLTLFIESGVDSGVELELTLPESAVITLNGVKSQLDDLRPGDRVVVSHAAEGRRRVVNELAAKRAVDFGAGVVRDIDAKEGWLTYSLAGSDDLMTHPFDDDCVVTLNGLNVRNQAVLKPRDLKPGDKIRRLRRDTHILRIDVYRTFSHAGVILQVRTDPAMIDVSTSEPGEFISFRIDKDCKLTLGADAVRLSELHRRDQVKITHDSPDGGNPAALAVKAIRPVDPSRWAVIVGVQKYDDKSLPPLKFTANDARRVRRSLVDRYGVDPDRAVELIDATRIRLEQEIADALKRAADAHQLVFYFAGHTFVDEQGEVFLAPRDFALARIATSGLPLKWLVGQLEKCTAREKILLLDGCHAAPEDVAKLQPSMAKFVEAYQASVPKPAFRTTTVIASCSGDQRGIDLNAKGSGRFAEILVRAFSGQADKNNDNRIVATELFEFAKSELAKPTAEGAATQTPALFLPDDTPRRLTEEAVKAIRALLALWKRPRINVDDLTDQFEVAQKLAEAEPEPELAFALVLLNAKKSSIAVNHFAELRLDHPDLWPAHAGSAWVQMLRGKHGTGIGILTQMISASPKPKKPGGKYTSQMVELFEWTGRLREFSARQMGTKAVSAVAALDAAIASHGEAAKQPYAKGRAVVGGRIDDVDKRFAAATSKGDRSLLRLQRGQLPRYAEFPFEAAIREVQERLEK